MKNSEKVESKYTSLILSKIGELFEEDKISIEEFTKEDNLTIFMHALSNCAPAILYGKFTGEDLNLLEFNHVANSLCFQFSEKVN